MSNPFNPFPSLFATGAALYTTKLRCKITGNECGTDTWGVGADGKIIPCKCESCTEYMRRREER